MKFLQKYMVLILGVSVFLAACSDEEKGGETFNLNVIGEVQAFDAAGGAQTLGFTSSAGWTAATDQAWCIVSPAEGAAGKNGITIYTEQNEGWDERNATVTLTSGTVVVSVTIAQKQKNALTITSSKAEVAASGGEVTVEVKANFTFEYIIEENASGWIQPLGTRGLTTSSLKFNVRQNEDVTKREGKIIIRSGERSEIFTVYQQGTSPELILTRNEYTVGSDTAEIKIEIKSNVLYEMQLPDIDWITERKSRAVSSYTHYLTISANESYSARSAEVLFVCQEMGVTRKVTITQMQKDAIVVAETLYQISGESGKLSFDVNANVDFEVSVSSDWIKRVPETRALKTTPLSFMIEENPVKESREGVITVKHGNISQQITIVQEGRKVFGRISVTHVNQLFTIPILRGTNVKGVILWGDTQQEEYGVGLLHTYTDGGPHIVTIESPGAEEVMLPDIIGVTELNLEDF